MVNEVSSVPVTAGVSARAWLLPLLAALMILPAGCGERRIRETPAELIGKWTTTFEGYEGASMEFTAEYFIIGTIENTFVTYGLDGFVIEEVADQTDYKIYYVDAGGNELSMEMIYTGDDGGSLRDKHQLAVVWTKEQ
jgi:hypothetical protein